MRSRAGDASLYPRPFANYVLLERLGVGGMSEVDLARRAVEEAGYVRLVVIKRIKADRSADDAFVRMFKDEARITAELSHPSIGRVYDFGREGDEYYLVLEYVPGIDLRQLVVDLAERRQRVPVRIALALLVHVLDALDHAHLKRDPRGRPMHIVHRDVNPRNIMVSVRGDVKLIDFGVASAVDRLERTRTDHVKGKFAYMAPEQMAGEKVDHRADLYAVGITLHELLTGQSPFAGLNQIQIMHRVMSQGIPKLPDIPEVSDAGPLHEVHRRALQRDPDQRYPSAAAFRDALLSVLANLGGMPEADALADFLRRTSPTTVTRIEGKIAQYSDLTGDVPTSEIGAPTPRADLREPDPTLLLADSRLGGSGPTQDVTASGSGTGRSASLLVTGILLGVVAAIALLVVGVAVGIALWIGWGPTGDVAPVGPTDAIAPAPAPPPPAAPRPPAADPAPAPPVRKDSPSVSPAPAAPAPPAPVRPDPSPVAPSPRPTAPAPAPAPAPVAPAVPPAPSGTGTVQVTAVIKGRAIRVDGAATGKVASASLTLPVGRHEVEVDGYPSQAVDVRKNQVHVLVFK